MGTMKLKISELLEIALIIRHINGLETGRVHDIRTTFKLATAFNTLSPILSSYNDALGGIQETATPKERQAIVKDLQEMEQEITLPDFPLSQLSKIEVSDSSTEPHDTFVPIPASFISALMPFVKDDIGEAPE